MLLWAMGQIHFSEELTENQWLASLEEPYYKPVGRARPAVSARVAAEEFAQMMKAKGRLNG